MIPEELLNDFDRLEFDFAKKVVEEANRKYGCDFIVMRTGTRGDYSAVSRRYTTRGTPKELSRSLGIYGSGFSHGRSDELKVGERYAALAKQLRLRTMTESEVREVMGLPKAAE